MDSDGNDEDLRTHFHDLRQVDERLARPFPQTWAVAVSLAGTPAQRRMWRLLAAGSALTVLGALALIGGSPVRRAGDEIAMSQWRSPTAALLAFPGEPVTKTAPRLGRPITNDGGVR